MSLFKRSGKWWFEFKHQGVRHRKSTKTANRGLAGRIERKYRSKVEEGSALVDPVSKPIKVSNAVSEFIEENDDWAPRTRITHENSWRHLKPHFGTLLLQDINRLAISKYRSARKAEGAGPRSINIEVGLLRMMLRRHDRWHSFQTQKFRMLREPEDVGRALTHDEEHRLLSAAYKSTSRSLYPAILLSIHTGMRHQELRLLRWRQVDLIESQIQVGKSKTASGEGRVIPLSQTALNCLKDWRIQFPDAGPSDAVFPSERYGLIGKKGTFGGVVKPYHHDPLKPVATWKTAWNTCRRNAGVQCRWHDMRHTFISRLGENKVGEQTLMGLTGHLSNKMLERYSHIRMEAKREAVRTLDRKPVEGMSPENDPHGDELRMA